MKAWGALERRKFENKQLTKVGLTYPPGGFRAPTADAVVQRSARHVLPCVPYLSFRCVFRARECVCVSDGGEEREGGGGWMEEGREGGKGGGES